MDHHLSTIKLLNDLCNQLTSDEDKVGVQIAKLDTVIKVASQARRVLKAKQKRVTSNLDNTKNRLSYETRNFRCLALHSVSLDPTKKNNVKVK